MSEAVHDASIVKGLRQGDSEAWRALCHKYGSAVWRHIARLVGNDADLIAELFQETMLAAARSGKTLELQRRVWSWLAGIAHNQAALHWRQVNRRREVYASASQATAAPQPTPDPASALMRGELADEVRSALAEMSADYAALLTAKYLDDLSIADIVEAFGGTEESVRSKLARARRDFRERFRHMEPESR